MANTTRFFLPITGAAPVSPSADPGWTDTTQFDRVAIGRSHRNETAVTKTEIFNGTTPAFVLMRQYVSEPLPAQTISGNLSGQIRGITSATGKNGSVAVAARIVQNDGTDYGSPKTLLSPTADTTSATPPFLPITTATNRSMHTAAGATALPLTSQTVAEGDRLVVEIGVRDTTAHATRTLGLSCGGVTITDLAVDNTTTTANYPWVQFDSNILMPPIERLKLSETVTAGIGFTTEIVHLSETVQTTLDPLQASPSELLKLHEELIVLGATLTETFKLADGGVATQQGIATLIGVLRVIDTVTAMMVAGDLAVVVTAETLKLSDTPFETLDPEQASPGETLRLADTVTPSLNPEQATPSETLRLSDTVIAALDESTSLSETLRLSDVVSTTLDPEQASPSETLRLSDTPQTTLDPEQATPGEQLKLSDAVTAVLDDGVILGETLRLSDTPQTILNPEQASGFDETLRLSDTVTASIGGDLSASATETVRLSDSVTASLDLIATPSETLKLSDAGGTQTLDPEQASGFDEALRLSDSVTPALTPEQASASEALRLADTVAATLTPEQATPTETLRLSAAVSTTLDPEQAAPSETLRLADTSAQTLDPEQAAPSEALRLSDAALTAQLDLGVILTELVHVSDAVTPRMGLVATPTETLRLSEELFVALGGGLFVAMNERLTVRDTVTPLIVYTLSGDVTEPLGAVAGTATVTNHQASPGCDTTAFSPGHIP